LNTRRSTGGLWLAPALVALAPIVISPTAAEAGPIGNALHCAPQEIAAGEAPAAPLSPLTRARRDCPLLGAIIEQYALQDLGEAFPEEATTLPSPDLALAANFAALGNISAMTRHARLARDAGAKPAKIRELLYLMAVSAGLPKAMEATRPLAEVLDEQKNRCPERFAGANFQRELR
jgi:alkylhydroperoxidase/carboxymuconolactone decarboxylase family protein YurZ